MAPTKNGSIIFREPPTDYPIPGKTIVYEESTIDPDNISLNGGILVKTLWISIDPYLRGRLREAHVKSYLPAFTLGEVIFGLGVVVVLRSEKDEVKVGDYLLSDLAPVDLDSPEFHLDAYIGTENATVLDKRLSLDLRVLLRADVRFKYRWTNIYCYYPKGFDCWDISGHAVTYDPRSSGIAKLLLGALQRPNASYLEMQAFGQSFMCGQCTGEADCYTWETIVTHYLGEREDTGQSSWQFSGREKKIMHTSTHDAGDIDTEKPLVYLVDKHNQALSMESSTSKCKRP